MLPKLNDKYSHIQKEVTEIVCSQLSQAGIEVEQPSTLLLQLQRGTFNFCLHSECSFVEVAAWIDSAFCEDVTLALLLKGPPDIYFVTLTVDVSAVLSPIEAM